MSGRIDFIDAGRGLAVLMMVVYHFLFDLKYFGIAGIDLEFLPLLLFQRATGSLFLMIAGTSMWLSQAEHPSYERHFQRFLKLALVALAITAATFVYPHEGFITFGIIHLIALSALIGPLFFRFGKWNLPIALALIVAGSLPPGLGSDSPYLFWLGFPDPFYTALDYYPIVPWFGVVLAGVFLGQSFFPDGRSRITLPKLPFQGALQTIGKHSLAIYLAHQPLIIAILLIYMGVA